MSTNIKTIDNYGNQIKKRTESIRPLEWSEVDSNFQYINFWETGKLYKIGMKVGYNDYHEIDNPNGQFSEWVCTSNHTSASISKPGIGAMWKRLNTTEEEIQAMIDERIIEFEEDELSANYLKLTGGTLSGGLTATEFVKVGGTATEFLKADGSVDSVAYLPNTGTQYLFVSAKGTPQENATELQASYDLAKTMSPSSGNIITVVVAPGEYTFGGTKFPVNTPYINIVSLTGNADVLLDGINVTADNIYLKGLNCEINRFLIADNLDELVCERCVGGDGSFGGGDASGTFTNCTGGSYSFGGGGAASGTFTNCTGGSNSFGGGGGFATGTFSNCIGGDYSFGGDGVAGGTFTDCTGGDYSFGGGTGTASGTFTDCTGGDYSFGGGDGGTGTASGTFTNCKGGDFSFAGYSTASGTFTDCTGGDYSFGGGTGTASGIFNNCTGGYASFGGGTGTASGIFNNCTGGYASFGGGAGTASGIFNYCTCGDYSFGGGEGGNGTTSGTFTDCTGGGGSFGGDGTISSTARLYYCRLTSGTFRTPASGGKIIACIDGNDDFIMIS